MYYTQGTALQSNLGAVKKNTVLFGILFPNGGPPAYFWEFQPFSFFTKNILAILGDFDLLGKIPK